MAYERSVTNRITRTNSSRQTLFNEGRAGAIATRLGHYLLRLMTSHAEAKSQSGQEIYETQLISIRNQKEPMALELYSRASSLPEALKRRLLIEISRVTKVAWEDFGDVVGNWFEWSDLLIIARHDGRVIGFSACRFEPDVLLYMASFILPEYQKTGVAKKLQNLAIKRFLLFRGPEKLMTRAWVTFRTRNPRVMQTAAKFNAYPNSSGRSPSRQEVDIARSVAQRFSPDCEFDDRFFVLKGALDDKPDLLAHDKVFFCKNELMNEFCKKHMEYEKGKGHLFISVGELKWHYKLYFLLCC